MKVTDINPGDVYCLTSGGNYTIFQDLNSGSTFLNRELKDKQEFMVLSVQLVKHSEKTHSVYANVMILGEDTYGWILVESKRVVYSTVRGVPVEKVVKTNWLRDWEKMASGKQQ
jgi:hypothetical protein